jgi:predicted nucleic acid-binding protein
MVALLSSVYEYLLDINALSEPPKKQPDEGFMERFLQSDDLDLYISCLSIGEIKKGITLLPKDDHSKQLDEWLAKTIPDFDGRVVLVDAPVCKIWGKLLGAGQKAGLIPPVIDALIAAQCIAYDLVLVTRNVKDFTQFTDLEVLCPWVK